MDQHRLHRLLAPRSLAFVGGREAEVAIGQCLALGFDGDLWPVHHRRDKVAGLPAFASVEDLPAPPDAVLVAVNRWATVETVGRLAALGTGAAVCYASGFAEVGAEGAELQNALVAAADGMPVIGPNCYGTVAATVGAALWPDQHGLRRVDRGVALVTQSGNIALNLTLQTRPMAISHVLTLGNQADVGIEECVEALLDDPSVSSIGLHVEALRDAGRFETACRRAFAAGVPVVALKTGSSPRGASIAASHTSSLVGDAAAYAALFDRVGVRQVGSIPELLDTLHLMNRFGAIGGPRLVSLSCSGGEASVVADRAESMGVEFPAFDIDHAARIAGTLNDLVSVSNPLDYHTFIWGDRERLTATFTTVLDGPLDAAMLVLDFPSGGLDDSTWWPTLEAFVAASQTTGTPGVIAASMAENLPGAAEAAAADAGLVAVRGIEAALLALEGSAWWGAHREQEPVLPVPSFDPAVTRIVHEPEAKDLLAEVGIPLPARETVPPFEAVEAASRIGYPVVVKATGVAHKTEVDGVAVGLVDGGGVAQAVDRLAGPSGETRLLVEEYVGDAVAELLINIRREPPVGWLLTLGSGGRLAEVAADVVSLILPVGPAEVTEALQRLAVWPLLAGHRGGPAADLDAIVEVVIRLQRLVSDRPELVEVEINPLLARPSGAIAVDALVTVDDFAVVD